MPEQERKKKKTQWESWFVLCDVTELHLWRESAFVAQLEPEPKNTHNPGCRRHLWGLSPLQNDLLQGQRDGEGEGGDGGADRTSQTPFPSAHLFFSVMQTHAHSHLMWILWVCGSSVYVSLCYLATYDWINALANEAHNEVCQQLIEDEGWKGRDWVRGGRGGEEKREEWIPELPMMGGEERRQPAADGCWVSVQRMLALWPLNPEAPACDDPHPLSSNV